LWFGKRRGNIYQVPGTPLKRDTKEILIAILCGDGKERESVSCFCFCFCFFLYRVHYKKKLAIVYVVSRKKRDTVVDRIARLVATSIEIKKKK
jgi:hypothetical protein